MKIPTRIPLIFLKCFINFNDHGGVSLAFWLFYHGGFCFSPRPLKHSELPKTILSKKKKKKRTVYLLTVFESPWHTQSIPSLGKGSKLEAFLPGGDLDLPAWPNAALTLHTDWELLQLQYSLSTPAPLLTCRGLHSRKGNLKVLLNLDAFC